MALGGLQNEADLDRYLEDKLRSFGAVDWNAIAGKPAYARIFQHTAPDDDALETGELAIWLDETPGATKVKFKAKDSDGTVRIGEVALI